MNISCPVCRADNKVGPNCRRCKADLSLLIELEASRTFHLAECLAAVQEARFEDALDELQSFDQLRHDPRTSRLRATILLLAGDFDSALEEYVNVVDGN